MSAASGNPGKQFPLCCCTLAHSSAPSSPASVLQARKFVYTSAKALLLAREPAQDLPFSYCRAPICCSILGRLQHMRSRSHNPPMQRLPMNTRGTWAQNNAAD